MHPVMCGCVCGVPFVSPSKALKRITSYDRGMCVG